MRTLYTIPYSPWSERARWALLHHRLAFEERAHVPLIGEVVLRARTRSGLGRLSVPLLVDDGEVVMDSLRIAEHADRVGEGAPLVPADHAEEIRALVDRVEEVFRAGRALGIRAIYRDDATAKAALPRPLRRIPFAPLMARIGSRYLAVKHRVGFDDIEGRLRQGLVGVREALGGRSHVHDTFTFADVACACAVQFIAPVADRFLRIDEPIRRRWSDAALAEEFADLVAWRDALYEKHRPS